MSLLELQVFKALVYEHCGLLLDGIAEDRLRQIVDSNRQHTGCATVQEYEQLVRSNPAQFDILVGQLTVNETYFFREPEQLQLLVDVLVPHILARKTTAGPVRILSAGCSSGEEPYSLVMALHQVYGERTARLFHVDAGDIDHNVLDKAQKGLYSEFSFRGVKPSIRERYFKPQARGYVLDPLIKEQVNFCFLNLLAPELPAQLIDYDIIFFRNVSIYFDEETRELIQHRFFKLMRTDSVLMLGSSETMGNDFSVFELVEQAGQYFFIKGDAYRPANSGPLTSLDTPAVADTTRRPMLAPEYRTASSIDLPSEPLLAPADTAEAVTLLAVETGANVNLEHIQQLIEDGEQQRALRLLEELPLDAQQRYPALLLKAWLLMNNQAFAPAQESLEQALAMEPWSVDAMLMQGLVYKWQEDAQQAQQWFKKVIYTRPECWPAHYYMADIRRIEGQTEAALKGYQTVLRILADSTADVRYTDWIPLPLAVSNATFLSQRHTQQLSADLDSTQVSS